MSFLKFAFRNCIILLFTAGILFYSCKREKFESISKAETLSPFREISIDNTFDVYLTQDTSYSIRLEGAKEFVDQINYFVSDSVLHLERNGKNSWLHPKKNSLSIYINSDSLHIVRANESSFIKTLNPIISNEFGIIMNSKLQEADLDLNCGTFFYWNVHPCGGKLTLHGQTNELKIWNAAIVNVDASDLSTNYALVENRAKSDCEVKVTNRIEYSIYGEGNIILHGNPAEIVRGEVTSSGDLIRQ